MLSIRPALLAESIVGARRHSLFYHCLLAARLLPLEVCVGVESARPVIGAAALFGLLTGVIRRRLDILAVLELDLAMHPDRNFPVSKVFPFTLGNSLQVDGLVPESDLALDGLVALRMLELSLSMVAISLQTVNMVPELGLVMQLKGLPLLEISIFLMPMSLQAVIGVLALGLVVDFTGLQLSEAFPFLVAISMQPDAWKVLESVLAVRRTSAFRLLNAFPFTAAISSQLEILVPASVPAMGTGPLLSPRLTTFSSTTAASLPLEPTVPESGLAIQPRTGSRRLEGR
jgi:hypothetical protein